MSLRCSRLRSIALHTVDMHIAKLRPKLRVATGGQWQIETVRGAGFVLTRREGETLESVGVGLAHPATPA